MSEKFYLSESSLILNEASLSEWWADFKKNRKTKKNAKQFRNFEKNLNQTRYFYNLFRKTEERYESLEEHKNSLRKLDAQTLLSFCEIFENYEIIIAYDYFVLRYEKYFKNRIKSPVQRNIESYKEYSKKMKQLLTKTLKTIEEMGNKEKSLKRLTKQDYKYKTIRYDSEGIPYETTVHVYDRSEYALILFDKKKVLECLKKNTIIIKQDTDEIFDLKEKIDKGLL